MLGLSLFKIVFTVLVIAAVWYGYKLWRRLQVRRDAMAEHVRVRRHEATRPRNPEPPSQTEDTVECRACGAFVAARGAVACGRADCPFPG